MDFTATSQEHIIEEHVTPRTDNNSLESEISNLSSSTVVSRSGKVLTSSLKNSSAHSKMSAKLLRACQSHTPLGMKYFSSLAPNDNEDPVSNNIKKEEEPNNTNQITV